MRSMKDFKQSHEGGYVVLLNTLIFIAIILALLFGALSPLFSYRATAKGLLSSKQAYLATQSASAEAFYRIKTGRTLPSSVTLALTSGTSTITTTTNGNNRSISITGTKDGYDRSMQMAISTGSGIDFNYGLQAGTDGMSINGGSTINGNIYSNSSINAISATITGSAVAADSAALTADQTNETPLPPPTSTTFRNAAATQDFAQSFRVTSDAPINKVQFYMRKTGAPANATVIIAANNAGSPNNTAITSATLNASLVTTSYGWIEVVFPTSISLIPGTTYWLIIQNGATSASANYTIGTNTAYANGTGRVGRYGGSWTATNDAYFRLFTGGIASTIGGAAYVGGVNIGGQAWATNVRGASVTGSLFCINGTNNNKACNTTRGAAPSEGLPFSDANIQAWKDAAAAGGSQGATTIGFAGGTLGPRVINGNLTVNGGGTLTLTGPLWVTGNVTITSGGRLRLPPGYGVNSESIVSDGIVTISGGGSVGSGTNGSYLFIVSTSKCPDDVGCGSNSAINISGGAGAIAASAQWGNVALSGGAAINAVVGNSITVTGGTTVTYDQGLASPSFQSGPSGGYNLDSWIEN